MMDNGCVVLDKVKESGKVLMETTFMLEIGLKIDLKVMELTHGQMVILQYFTIYNLGDRYDGEWIACKKHGKGADFFANGDTYVGEYKDGKPHGLGTYTWASGS